MCLWKVVMEILSEESEMNALNEVVRIVGDYQGGHLPHSISYDYRWGEVIKSK